MAGRKTINAINWGAIAERISEADKPIFASFRSKSDVYLRRMQQYPENVPKIDWAYYKKQIAVAGMVDNFQKEYDALKVAYPADTYTPIVEEQEKDAASHVAKFIKESENRIESFQSEIERISKLMPFNEMTMEDYAAAYPNLAWNADKPTIWPHLPECQPIDDKPEPIPEPEH